MIERLDNALADIAHEVAPAAELSRLADRRRAHEAERQKFFTHEELERLEGIGA